MKKTKLFYGLMVVLTLGLSSCHRGIGCPSDFSLDLDFVNTIGSLIAALPF